MSLGMGVMINMLFGNGGEDAQKYIGKTITKVSMTGEDYLDGLNITFDDGKTILIADHGQSCCEDRHMTTDDDIQSLVGQKLHSIESRDGGSVEHAYDSHETAFVVVQGDQSSITLCTHVIHNGYYGGFSLQITEKEG